LREKYTETASRITPEDRAAYHETIRDRGVPAQRVPENVREIISALDERGAWLTDGLRVNEPNAKTAAEARPAIRGISTRTFVENMRALIAALDEKGEGR
jgi:hypothetical protein